MKVLFITLIFVFIASKCISQDVYYTLTNPRDVQENGIDYHYADVIIYSNVGFKLGSGQLYFNYDTTAFGQNIKQNGGMQIIAPVLSSILGKRIGSPPFQFNFYNDIILNDNTNSKFSVSWQHVFSESCMETSNVNYYSDILFTLKLKYKSGLAGSQTGLCIENTMVYSNQTYTACGPNPCNTKDCFNFPGLQLTSDIMTCSDCRIVYSTSNTGIGSLREAISCSQPGDTIRFARNLQFDSIVIIANQIGIEKDLYVIAKPEFGICVNGVSTNRVFEIIAGKNVLIEGLRLVTGSENEGSGIKNNGNLILKDVNIYYNLEQIGESHLLNLGTLHIDGDVIILKLN